MWGWEDVNHLLISISRQPGAYFVDSPTITSCQGNFSFWAWVPGQALWCCMSDRCVRKLNLCSGPHLSHPSASGQWGREPHCINHELWKRRVPQCISSSSSSSICLSFCLFAVTARRRRRPRTPALCPAASPPGQTHPSPPHYRCTQLVWLRHSKKW